jgi:hypothetical protein
VGASSEEGKKGFSYKCAEDNGTDYVNTSISGRSMRKGSCSLVAFGSRPLAIGFGFIDALRNCNHLSNCYLERRRTPESKDPAFVRCGKAAERHSRDDVFTRSRELPFWDSRNLRLPRIQPTFSSWAVTFASSATARKRPAVAIATAVSARDGTTSASAVMAGITASTAGKPVTWLRRTKIRHAVSRTAA